IENIVIVHHTWCGATSFTTDGLIAAHRREQGADISRLYERESVSISDFATSLRHDVGRVRASPGTPRHASIYGYLYDIDTEELVRVVEDRSPEGARSARVPSRTPACPAPRSPFPHTVVRRR